MAQVKDKKRILGARGSDNQKKELVFHLEKDLALAKNQFNTQDGKVELRKKWDNLAMKLNSLGGLNKTGFGWKKYWDDLRTRVRKKYTALKAVMAESGRNGDIVLEFDDIEQKILTIITIDAVDGDGVSEDIGLPSGSNADSALIIPCQGVNKDYENPLPVPCKEGNTSDSSNEAIVLSPAPATRCSEKDRKRKNEVHDDTESFKKLLKLKEEKLYLIKEDNERKKKKEQRQIERHEIEMKILKKKLEMQYYRILDDLECDANLE